MPASKKNTGKTGATAQPPEAARHKVAIPC